jgi:hypothetical protein
MLGMKRIFIVAFLLGNLIQMFGQADFEAKDRDRIATNDVKRQIQWEYDYINGVPSTKGYKCSATTYDKNGNPVEIINYDQNGTISSVLVYTYDAQNNKTSYSRFKGNKDQLSYNQTLKYDQKGNKIIESGFDGTSTFYNSFYYGTNGKLSEIIYTADKVLIEKRTFKYAGNTTEMSIVSPTNVLLSKEISILDSKNNVLEETKYVQNNVAQKSNFAYDPSGKKLEETKENFGTLVYRRKYTYAPSGNLVQVSEEDSNMKPFISYQYKYDAKGNAVEMKWAKEPGKEYSKKSNKFDAKGLLTETEFYNATYKLNVLYKYTYETF